jgi:hypothetical protein
MVRNLKLAGPMFGGQSTLAPSLPTAIDFFASLPSATAVFATTNRPLFPDFTRLLDSTEILAFLSRHHLRPIDMPPAIHRVSRTLGWRIRSLSEGN